LVLFFKKELLHMPSGRYPMRGIVFHNAGHPLALEHLPDPVPADREVVIRVGRCGICSSDVSMTDARSSFHFAPGAVLGHEYAGEIVALGRSVETLKIGDRVTALPTAGCGTCAACRAGDPNACAACRYVMGGFAEYTTADAALVVKLPDALSLDDGALVEPLACGMQAVRLAGIGPGSRVLMLGAGPIGLAALYAARRAGAGRVAVCARSRRAAPLASAMGADNFIEQGSDVARRVADALGGAPEFVIECVGIPGLLEQAIEIVARRGTIVIAGLCFDAQPVAFGAALMKQVTLRFSLAYTLADFHRAVNALDAGHLEPRVMLGETIALTSVPAAIEEMRNTRHTGKLMVDPWRPAPVKEVV
jgi:threonine dehydrogenase-like Zn-dependent dehydrogenase